MCSVDLRISNHLSDGSHDELSDDEYESKIIVDDSIVDTSSGNHSIMKVL